MQFLNLTLPTPAANLAADEALLDWREEEGGGEVLRFWEPSQIFVVVGYSNKVTAEANVPACVDNQVPILRRCSGGGTVLQGPGVLNYSLILNIASSTALDGIHSANCFVMERNRAALEREVRKHHPETILSVCGHTDLAFIASPVPRLAPLKFSGNAQRRKRRFILFHGTFLLGLDLSLVETFLAMPVLQPDYRQGRHHLDFVANLSLPPKSVRDALRAAWRADAPLEDLPHERIESLRRNKYETDGWNHKF